MPRPKKSPDSTQKNKPSEESVERVTKIFTTDALIKQITNWAMTGATEAGKELSQKIYALTMTHTAFDRIAAVTQVNIFLLAHALDVLKATQAEMKEGKVGVPHAKNR